MNIIQIISLILFITFSSIPLSVNYANAGACVNQLSGRLIELDASLSSFGAVQGQPPLPLRRNEYLITIDDGPNPKTTPHLLSILESYCVKGTFFLTGSNAARNPDLVKKIAEHGHMIGSHSFSHPDLRKMSQKDILAEIRRGADSVEKAQFGKREKQDGMHLIRLPGSAGASPIPPMELIHSLWRHKFVIAGYDLSPQDWRNSPPQESFKRLFQTIKDRGIIVFHDGQPNTILLLPMVLDELHQRGARIAELAFPKAK